MPKYTLNSIEYITPSIIKVSLAKPANVKQMLFKPGQYATISYRLHGRPSAVRCFSIASSPLDNNSIEFGIRVAGKFTKKLATLKPGNFIELDGPYGDFVLPPDPNKNLVFCAGGIGITPFMSMVRYEAATKSQRNIVLIVSARSAAEIAYYQELQNLEANNIHLRVIYVIGNGDIPNDVRPGNIKSGRITPEILKDAFVTVSSTDYYLCGPPAFMNSVTDMLTSIGASQFSIITEAFAQGHNHTLNNSRDWPSTIYLTGAFATAIASGIVMTNETLKTITPTLLPETLTAEMQNNGQSARQQDLNKLVNSLQNASNTVKESPNLTSAFQEVAKAEATIAAINPSAAQTTSNQSKTASPTNRQTQTSPTASTSTSPAASSQPPATPAPTPPPPVCTTSASGVKTCQ